MRAPAVSFAKRFVAAFIAALLTVTLLPASALAEGEGDSADAPAEEPQEVGSEQVDEDPSVVPMLASGLVGSPTVFINSDVALDSEPIVGSFTVDGMTFAVTEGSDVELVGVSPDRQQVASSQEGDSSPVAPMLASGSDGLDAGSSALAVPESVTYEGVDYTVASIGAYAFYLSGVASVELPATVTDVDDRAFRSSDVASVTVADGNASYSSFDGALYDAAQLSLLLIPEGKQGTVLLPMTAESAAPSVFSHCPLVTQVSVEEGSAAFASENGLLYDASLTTLLRVPAGATDIIIRDGCTTIAAGAMEACASLATITAPASVTFISPDVFTSVPTVSLPAVSAAADDPRASTGATEELSVQGGSISASGSTNTQLTAMVALSTTDDDLPEVDPVAIEVGPMEDTLASCWGMLGFCIDGKSPLDATSLASVQSAEGAHANGYRVTATIHSRDGATLVLKRYDSANNLVSAQDVGTAYTINANGSVAAVPSLIGFHLTASDPGYDYCQIVPTKAGYSCIGFEGTAQVNASHPNYPIVDGDILTAIYGAPYSFTVNAGVGALLDVDRFWQDPDAEGEFYLHGIESYVPSYSGFAGVSDDQRFIGIWEPADSRSGWYYKATPKRTGYHVSGWSGGPIAPGCTVTAQWAPNSYTVSFSNPEGEPVDSVGMTYDAEATLPAPANRADFAFRGWDTLADGSGTRYQSGQQVSNLTSEEDGSVVLYAQWERVGFDVSFDVDSEPGDEDYPGNLKDDEKVNIKDGQVQIEDPKRPGYVFQGWTIPNAEGTEAIDQDLVYQDESDGKWYVDASKVPDYADDDGRVELTARWTSVISVDVPSAVTFYADVVTQGNESREGAASSAFGQNKVASQSQVDLRIVGLESTAVQTQGTTLGADSILKKSDAATPSSSTQKLFSLYPTDRALTPDDLQDPDAVSQAKPADAVDFALDDLLLEKSFAADAFTIPAGDTLNLGYRLNLAETGTELDYDTLATLDEGQSASIANISYTFAADYSSPADWGEPLWIENPDTSPGAPRFLVLDDIKAAAEDLSAHADDLTQSEYYALYKDLLGHQVMENGAPGEGPYFQLKVEGAVDDYLDLQLIGICQDTKSDGTGKAGLTFQMRDIYAYNNTKSIEAGGDAFNYTYMNSVNTNSGGWASCTMRNTLRTTFWRCLPERMQTAIVGIDKHHQLYGGSSASYLQRTTDETVWLPSFYEVFGVSFANYNESEALAGVSGYKPFQYIAYQGSSSSAVNNRAVKTYNGSVLEWWLRSADRSGSIYYSLILSNGGYGGYHATSHAGIAPCFCL